MNAFAVATDDDAAPYASTPIFLTPSIFMIRAGKSYVRSPKGLLFPEDDRMSSLPFCW